NLKRSNLPFLSKVFVPPNKKTERLSTTFFIAAAAFPFKGFPSNTLPIPSVTPNDATVPRSWNTKSSNGPPCTKDFTFLAHISACCIAACAVGGNGRPASSSITQAQSPNTNTLSKPGARKSLFTVTFPRVNSNPDSPKTELPVTPPVHTIVPALISSLSSPTIKLSSVHSLIAVPKRNSTTRSANDFFAYSTKSLSNIGKIDGIASRLMIRTLRRSLSYFLHNCGTRSASSQTNSIYVNQAPTSKIVTSDSLHFDFLFSR